jgi:hypothetical protein
MNISWSKKAHFSPPQDNSQPQGWFLMPEEEPKIGALFM